MTHRHTWPAGHPVFAGHFPHTPIVPGALLLDWVMRCAQAGGLIPQAKFHAPLHPDEEACCTLTTHHGSLRFSVHHGTRLIASGSLAAAVTA